MIVSIRRNVAWRAIPVAALLSAIIFLAIQLIVSALVLNISPRLFLQYAASLVLGEGVLLDLGADIVVVGLIVHFVLSLLFTLLIAVVVHRWGLLIGIAGGALLGLCLYAINLYTMTLLFPWFFAINSTVLLLSHVGFGAVAGGIYEMLDTYDEPVVKEATS